MKNFIAILVVILIVYDFVHASRFKDFAYNFKSKMASAWDTLFSLKKNEIKVKKGWPSIDCCYGSIENDTLNFENIIDNTLNFENIYDDYGYSSYEAVQRQINKNFYMKRKNWKTSNLGAVLFKNVPPEVFLDKSKENRTYVILLWKYWDWLKKRHVENFKENEIRTTVPIEDISPDCSVKNCYVTGDDSKLNTADAVVVHINKMVLPNTKNRNQTQRWILLSDESPKHKFFMAERSHDLSELNNIFNWTMTYRTDCDVPVPNGRTLPLQTPVQVDLSDVQLALNKLVPYWSVKTIKPLATIVFSHCMTYRLRLIENLRRFFKVDIFGKCSDKMKHRNACPGYFKADCKFPAKSLFYLVLENSKCRQYITEKVFYHAFSKGAIPVIKGPKLEDLKKLLPPKSFLYVDNYSDYSDLAREMLKIAKDDREILSYHEWRKHFRVVNEHGYFQTESYHFCRVCEALNYNEPTTKIYTTESNVVANNSLRLFFDENLLCDLGDTDFNF